MLEIFLFLIKNAPELYTATVDLYHKVKGDLSETDQAAIEKALADAQANDAKETAQADTALTDAASK